MQYNNIGIAKKCRKQNVAHKMSQAQKIAGIKSRSTKRRGTKRRGTKCRGTKCRRAKVFIKKVFLL